MKKLLFTTALAALFSVGAQAAIVTYSTSTSQLCIGAAGCGVLSQNLAGIVNVTFSPVGTSSVNANPTTFSSFGEITISCTGGGTGCGSASLAGLNLYINIAQTQPSAGNGSISGGVIAGAISGTASSATITWATPNQIAIGNITYSIANNPLAIVPPSVNAGVTSVQAVITDRLIPEPSTYAMLSSGLVALGLLRRRR